MTSPSQNLKVPVVSGLYEVVFHYFEEVITGFQKEIFSLIVETHEIWPLVNRILKGKKKDFSPLI